MELVDNPLLILLICQALPILKPELAIISGVSKGKEESAR
jgi:hypothetical protein